MTAVRQPRTEVDKSDDQRRFEIKLLREQLRDIGFQYERLRERLGCLLRDERAKAAGLASGASRNAAAKRRYEVIAASYAELMRRRWRSNESHMQIVQELARKHGVAIRTVARALKAATNTPP